MPKIAPIDWRKPEKVFIAEGFVFRGQKGSHRAYIKPGINRPVIIPAYDEIGQDIIPSNLRTAGISRESYFKRLEEV